jgi:hypothetical protein
MGPDSRPDRPEFLDSTALAKRRGSTRRPRLPVRFVPGSGEGHSRRAGLLDWLGYYSDQKLLLRFSSAAERGSTATG